MKAQASPAQPFGERPHGAALTAVPSGPGPFPSPAALSPAAPSPAAQWSAGQLVGRGRELAAIGAFVTALPGRGGALLLTGEPGVGKSALLDVAEEQAAGAGHRVLRAAGAQSEDMSFAALNQLLRPLRGDLDQLGDPQRNALNAALGFTDEPGSGPLVTSNAVLALLDQAAGGRPLLLVIDDLQWLDQASAQVLGFVSRRLRQSPVGLIAAGRTEAAVPSGLDGPGHEVRPLDADDSARLLTLRFPGLAPAVRYRIITEARGNALALVELPAALSRPQRSALAPLPAVLPLSGRLRALVLAQVSALPPATRYLLLLAALDGTGELAPLAEAGVDALAPAADGGLVRVDRASARIDFAHPVVRSGVLQVSPGSAVRQAHLALAARAGDQPDRRAWHLAAAAAELDRGAAAVPLVPPPGRPPEPGDADQARQHATAAYLTASALGDLGAAGALLADARRAAPSAEPPAETAFATAFVLLHEDGDVAAAHRLVLRGLETLNAGDAGDAGPLSAEQALWILVAVCRLTNRAEHWESLERLIAARGAAVPVTVRAAVRGALDPRAVTGLPDAGPGSSADQAGPAQVVQLALASAFADRLADCRQALRQVARLGPGGSGGSPALQAGILLALEAFQTGQWDEAWRLAETAAGECASRGYQLLHQQARTVLAAVAAARGDAATSQALADAVSRWSGPRQMTYLTAGAHYVGVLAALGQSDFAGAYQHAASISPAGDIPDHPPYAAWALLDFVEAALRTARRDEAVAHVEAARRAGLGATSPRMELLTTAAMAMTAPDDAAPPLFERALASVDGGRWPFEQARVHLLYGERLRRLRAVGEARDHLGAAFSAFRRLGAPTWADRAATALRAAGQARPGGAGRREQPERQELTPHELEIARLAAVGLSNKEIGERLFMSHRTVASHLYKMFPKLGITSRAALGQVLPRNQA